MKKSDLCVEIQQPQGSTHEKKERDAFVATEKCNVVAMHRMESTWLHLFRNLLASKVLLQNRYSPFIVWECF